MLQRRRTFDELVHLADEQRAEQASRRLSRKLWRARMRGNFLCDRCTKEISERDVVDGLCLCRKCRRRRAALHAAQEREARARGNCVCKECRAEVSSVTAGYCDECLRARQDNSTPSSKARDARERERSNELREMRELER